MTAPQSSTPDNAELSSGLQKSLGPVMLWGLGVGYVIPMIYLAWAWRKGPKAPQNPWGATGLEWEKAPTPPPIYNFLDPPVVTSDPYNYALGIQSDVLGPGESADSPGGMNG